MKADEISGQRGGVQDRDEKPMKHTWIIEPTDIKKVKAFLALHRNDLFVRERFRWLLGIVANLKAPK